MKTNFSKKLLRTVAYVTDSKKLLRTVAYVTEKEVEKNNSKWPPRCMGIFHQPVRPQKMQDAK